MNDPKKSKNQGALAKSAGEADQMEIKAKNRLIIAALRELIVEDGVDIVNLSNDSQSTSASSPGQQTN